MTPTEPHIHCDLPFRFKMERLKGCYIDKDDVFHYDEKEMLPWFKQAMSEISDMHPELESIPFLVFLMGCEAGLRCQETKKLH